MRGGFCKTASSARARSGQSASRATGLARDSPHAGSAAPLTPLGLRARHGVRARGSRLPFRLRQT
eukprot:3321315-Prymnesium_polylepis.1